MPRQFSSSEKVGLHRASGKTPARNIWAYGLAVFLLGSGCDFKLPSPPPDLFYKFNTLQTGQGPADLLSADLDLDGEIDIVSANTKNSTITIHYGDGDGTFRAPMHIGVPAEPTSLAIGDLNHDQIPDIIVNARGANSFSALLGKKGRAFSKARSHKTGRVPLTVIASDYNGDGHLDVAVTLTFDKLEIYLGGGNGYFKKGETYLTGSRSCSGVAQDFNGDRNVDIALAATSSQSSAIRLFFGNGDGTFAKPKTLAVGEMPLGLIAQDMNGDGFADLISATGKGDNMVLLYSNGDGSFREKIDFSGGGGPIDLVAGNFNQDDRIDVAVANSRASNWSLVIRNKAGFFQYPTRDYVIDGGTPLAITSADYNNDDLADIAVASNAKNTVEIYLQKRLFR
jgi:hypothetical protein